MREGLHGDVKVLVLKGIAFSEPRVISINPWDRRPPAEKTVALSPNIAGLSPFEIDQRIKGLRIRVPAGTSPRGGVIEMNAKFNGRCSNCQKEIRAGARIRFDTEKRSASHAECQIPKVQHRPSQPKPPEAVRWAGMADTRRTQAELIYRADDGEIRHKIIAWEGSTNYPAVREWARQYSDGPPPHCVRVTLGARVLAEWKR